MPRRINHIPASMLHAVDQHDLANTDTTTRQQARPQPIDSIDFANVQERATIGFAQARNTRSAMPYSVAPTRPPILQPVTGRSGNHDSYASKLAAAAARTHLKLPDQGMQSRLRLHLNNSVPSADTGPDDIHSFGLATGAVRHDQALRIPQQYPTRQCPQTNLPAHAEDHHRYATVLNTAHLHAHAGSDETATVNGRPPSHGRHAAALHSDNWQTSTMSSPFTALQNDHTDIAIFLPRTADPAIQLSAHQSGHSENPTTNTTRSGEFRTVVRFESSFQDGCSSKTACPGFEYPTRRCWCPHQSVFDSSSRLYTPTF